jgi:hypothetical protein
MSPDIESNRKTLTVSPNKWVGIGGGPYMQSGVGGSVSVQWMLSFSQAPFFLPCLQDCAGLLPCDDIIAAAPCDWEGER